MLIIDCFIGWGIVVRGRGNVFFWGVVIVVFKVFVGGICGKIFFIKFMGV